MSFHSLISVITIFIFSICSLIQAQQPYVGLTTTDCSTPHKSSSGLGYFCNGNQSCQGYLTFKSQPPYNTVATISALLGTDQSQLSQIYNSVSANAAFNTNQLVVVPVNCSCSGEYYQVNASYVTNTGDYYLLIANNTFQGLSTCQALQNQSNIPSTTLPSGTRITVPLRCACPTKNQSDVGINYLLSYLVSMGDTVFDISSRFHVNTTSTLEANELQTSNINFFTTLLIPLQDQPSPSEIIAPPPPPASPPPPPPPPASSSKKSSSKTWVYVLVGVLGGAALVLVFVTVLFCRVFRKNKKKSNPILVPDGFKAYQKSGQKKVEDESEDFLEAISSVAQPLKVYKFRELQQATDDFSPTCWIEGSVYRGTINGDLAAIKKINGDVSKEIALLNKINHSNVIRLSGVCFNGGHWYLVYEFAVNGPLSDWIYHNNSDGKLLKWTQRIRIALDVATGLNYLHSFTAPSHVHKDINSGNILLDSDFRAKIANFGLARSAEGQEGEFSLTKHIVGTKGYMAPEYLENGLVSTKLDVYSFGVLMLEILTGKDAAAKKQNVYLADVLNNVLREEDEQESLRHFMDPSLQGNYPSELAVFVVRLIDSCLKKDPAGRPAIEEIEQSLSRTLNTSMTWESSQNISSTKASV